MKIKNKKGFSLVELVIVIVILAVISAIALPRISRGAKGVDEASLGQNLAIVRSAIEMYSAEHSGAYPGANGDGVNLANTEAAFKSQLLQYSDKQGNTNTSKGGAFIFGPYLHKVPPVPVGANVGKDTVTVAAGNPVVGGAVGWVYSTASGELIANSGDNDESGTKTYDQW